MAVYDLKETNWNEIEKYWEYEIPEEYKDETVFQMEPFPKHGDKKITFISHVHEVVKVVSEKFGVVENKYWTSVGGQGLKRLTGENSKWYNVPLKKVIEYTPMTKEQWQNCLKKLQDQYHDFSTQYAKSKEAKNKSEREDAESNVRIIIEQTKKYIRQNEQIYQILTNGDTSNFGRAIVMDEFSTARYFDHDMAKLTSEVKKKIDEL